jgi:IS30 family transposase
MADNRRREKAKPKIPEEVWCIVSDLIEKDWSPEQISGWLLKKICGSAMSAFTNTSPATRNREEACIFTCDAERKEKNVMEALTGGGRSKIGCR